MFKSQEITQQLSSRFSKTGTTRAVPLRLLIRADAGPSIGTGHVLRMLSLAESWQDLAGEVAMVGGPLPNGLLRRIRQQNIAYAQIPDANCNAGDAKALSEVAAHFKPDWIALDGTRLDAAYQRRIANIAARVLVPNDAILDSDLNPALTLLRSNRRLETETIQRRVPVMARRILVVIEPDTSENWTLRSLEVLENLNRSKIVVDCVIGNQHPHASSLNQFKLDSKLNLRIHQNVDRLDALMPRADLAIVSRNTVMELAHQGVPSLVVSSTGQNQWMEKMHESGAIVLLDSEQQTLLEPPKSPTEHLRIVLKKLLDDQKTRKQMSETARRIVDGRGSIRVAKKMAAAVTHSLKKSA